MIDKFKMAIDFLGWEKQDVNDVNNWCLANKDKLEKKKHSKNVYKEKINTEEEKKKSNEKIKKKIDLDATCEYVFTFNKEKKQ